MITAIVPARSGSKRLPGKNIKLLAGRPLIFHTLDAVLEHEEISKVIFTTDSDRYLELVARHYGQRVTLEKRPDDYANDTTKVHDEIVRLQETGVLQTEWFILCLPTAPLRSHATVDRLLKSWREEKVALFTASEYGFPIQFAFEIKNDGTWSPILDDSPMITGATRSQDIPKRYRPNGAIYLNTTDSLKNFQTFYIGAKPFLISDTESMDIDTELDFLVAEKLINQEKHE